MIQAKLPRDGTSEEKWAGMIPEFEECKKLAWEVQPKRRILARLEMAKGAETGRSTTRNSHLKVLQYIPEGLSSFANWAQMWALELANKVETQPQIREVDDWDGSTKTKLRPIALLETPLTLIESVAVDQHTHIIARCVRDRAEAMISAVRKIPEE